MSSAPHTPRGEENAALGLHKRIGGEQKVTRNVEYEMFIVSQNSNCVKFTFVLNVILRNSISKMSV